MSGRGPALACATKWSRFTGGQAFVLRHGGVRRREELEPRQREGQRKPHVLVWDMMESSGKGLSLVMVGLGCKLRGLN